MVRKKEEMNMLKSSQAVSHVSVELKTNISEISSGLMAALKCWCVCMTRTETLQQGTTAQLQSFTVISTNGKQV
jgi:hypothetical protein